MPPGDLPRSLGRYEVLGELGVGGMAEIFLARHSGPGAFERPVVLKRILPHLARDPSFVTMFLDEAKIVAGIRHPQVAHVHELARDGDELFLVMEYVEGETVGALMSRLAARGETLDAPLAAHIVAEACAGLHAAHELRDAHGALRNLVHRDVSPQNIMVTYGGEVKLLDFGIAKTSDRAGRTDTGRVKGKHEYMSPEQCRSEPMDRRSDLFSLGVVLYELSVGKRLFRRENALLTFKAICEMPIAFPRDRDDAYPEALDAICRRALERRAEDRYANGLEMRRELVAAGRALAAGEVEAVEEEALAGVMQRLFGERMAEKHEMLKRIGARIAEAKTPTHHAGVDASTARPRASGAPLVVALVAAVIALAGVAVVVSVVVASPSRGEPVSTTPVAAPGGRVVETVPAIRLEASPPAPLPSARPPSSPSALRRAPSLRASAVPAVAAPPTLAPVPPPVPSATASAQRFERFD